MTTSRWEQLANRGSVNRPFGALEHGTPAAMHEAPVGSGVVNDHRRREWRTEPPVHVEPAGAVEPRAHTANPRRLLSLSRDGDVPELVLELLRYMERDMRLNPSRYRWPRSHEA